MIGGDPMRHKVRALVPVEKRSLFGTKTVYEEKKVEVDGATYRKMKRAERNREYGIGEMTFYDEMWGDN